MAFDLNSNELHALLAAIILSGDKQPYADASRSPDPRQQAVNNALELANMIVQKAQKGH